MPSKKSTSGNSGSSKGTQKTQKQGASGKGSVSTKKGSASTSKKGSASTSKKGSASTLKKGSASTLKKGAASTKSAKAKGSSVSDKKRPSLIVPSKKQSPVSSETIDFKPTTRPWPKTRYESLSTWQILINEADNELRKPYPIYSYAEHKLYDAIRAMAPVCSYETEFASAISALANLYYQSNRYNEARATIQQLDKLYQPYGYDENDMCFVFEIIASEYNRLGLYDDAIRVCHDAINQIERQAHDKGIVLRKGQDMYDEDDWVSDESERFNRLIKYANKAKLELQRNKETIDSLSELRKR